MTIVIYVYVNIIKDDGQGRISESAGRPEGYQSILPGDSIKRGSKLPL